MKMLTVAARERLAEFAREYDLHPGDALNVLLEVVVPELDPDTIAGILDDDARVQWMRMGIGEHVEVEVPLGDEAAFRARVARFRRNTGRTITVEKVAPTFFRLTRHLELPA